MTEAEKEARHQQAVSQIADQIIAYRIKHPKLTDGALIAMLQLQQVAMCKQKKFSAQRAFEHCMLATKIIQKALALSKTIVRNN